MKKMCNKESFLDNVKLNLLSGLPAVFCFALYMFCSHAGVLIQLTFLLHITQEICWKCWKSSQIFGFSEIVSCPGVCHSKTQSKASSSNFSRFFSNATFACNLINHHSDVCSLWLLPLSEGSMQNNCHNFHNQSIFHTYLALSCNYLNITRFVDVSWSSFENYSFSITVSLFLSICFL